MQFTLKSRTVIALACLCAAAGLFAVYGTVATLLDIWSSDALKSVGMAVPFVCFALILRDWRSIGWETEGSWWGFVLLVFTVVLLFIRDQTLFIVTVNKDWLLQLPPVSLIAVLYAASLVLLFGGMRLLRAAWFPVVLMWAVIPVPEFCALDWGASDVVGFEDHVCSERGDVYCAGMRWAAWGDHDGTDGDRDCVSVPVSVVHLSAGGSGRGVAGVCVQLSAALRDGGVRQDFGVVSKAGAA
jgi:hypothetical protein